MPILGTLASSFDNTVAARGLFGGGYAASPGVVNVIDYVEIATTGNATDFGDLTVARYAIGGCSSSTRGLFGGGDLTGPSNQNVIDYITIDSTGNATDFGDLTVARNYMASFSNETRGIWAGGGLGFAGDSLENVIDYVSIASTGNATDFGDLNAAQGFGVGSCSSSTRGVFGGGSTAGNETATNVMGYLTIATTGNSTSFGDLTTSRKEIRGGISSGTRGIFAGGGSNVIDYVTIATTGNATDFGDLTGSATGAASTSSTIRGITHLGISGSFVNIIDYVTIDTTGNATDFGDLTRTGYNLSALSNTHGGL
jgi:hypothetical protein